MRCLVTGASGFLGSWLTRQLLREGHEVLAVVRPGGEHPRLKAIASHIELVYADLGTIKNISTEVKQFAADITFHLAWWGGNSSRHVNDPEQVYTNVPGTLDLSADCPRCGLPRILLFRNFSRVWDLQGARAGDRPCLPSKSVRAREIRNDAVSPGALLPMEDAFLWRQAILDIRPYGRRTPHDSLCDSTAARWQQAKGHRR